MAKNHFEFHDYQLAFEAWDALAPEEKSNSKFVIDNNFFTSGYWIEPAAAPELHDGIVYKTDADVKALRQRIDAEKELAVIEGRTPRFTT